ncbi:MAG TPA: DUF6319 family protein [Mycobacteriales bacterium]|jgi:hypothetical protein|nr:DUF6319 family protein [Mycobacteriales bacterium]
MADPRPADDPRTGSGPAGLDQAEASADTEATAVQTAADTEAPVDPGQTAIDGLAAGEPDPKPKRGRRKQAATKTQGVELVLTVTGNVDGSDWRAVVTHTGKTLVADLPVPTSAVSAAAKDLHPDIAEAIEGVLSAAREQQRSRVEALQAQLEAARQALAGLEE